MKNVMLSIQPQYSVYIHTFPNGKRYIGITSKKPYQRWQNGNGYKTQVKLYNAILKYGWDNIIHEVVLNGITKSEAEIKEIELIKYYKSHLVKYGYNISLGGNSNLGYKHSEEAKQKMRISHLGVKQTETHTQNLRIATADNLTGQKYNRLTVIERCFLKSRAYWLCKCECGNEKIFRADHLKLGKSQSCGCLQKELLVQRNKTEEHRNLVKKIMKNNNRRSKK